jgi:hypothetical protein
LQTQSEGNAIKERKEKKKKVISKPLKISFEDSELFDKVKFKETFNEWSTDKLRHYYDAALRYSIEGNKYVSWKLAIEAWERKDIINNVKYKSEVSNESDIDYARRMWMEKNGGN